MRLAFRENISASLARREKCNILSSLRVSQFVSLAFTRCTNKQSHNSGKISNDSRYEISVCKTRKSRYEICLRDSRGVSLATKFLSARLVKSDFRYKISKQDLHFAILATKFLPVRLERSESCY
jgi:hypothetical protein